MATHHVTTKWLGDMAFEATNPGGKIKMDSDPEYGGHDDGLRPKSMMLASLAGCTGIDIASLIKKMKVDIDTFSIEVEGDLTEEHPKYYHTVRVDYHFYGLNLDETKLQKIVDLSVEKYCGVMEMFRHFAKVEVRILYHPN
ncbi:putative redox protein [Flavobacterium gossypii]|uniref:Redox protein n=1 Tax=Flavobacterium gossypii TaxID=1646119 RepID=A0ABR6DNR5_9FLAO|nr:MULTISPECIES: OsmC family protein [Flavobacterium]MBA9073073.1 putative redox protein [Flavobacterium gossypii]WDO13532.1 OsmC family protein [Flavobacterium sp. WW92]